MNGEAYTGSNFWYGDAGGYISRSSQRRWLKIFILALMLTIPGGSVSYFCLLSAFQRRRSVYMIIGGLLPQHMDRYGWEQYVSQEETSQS